MIYNPKAIKHVVIDGHSLTLESFVAVSRFGATVEVAPAAIEAMKKSRALAEKSPLRSAWPTASPPASVTSRRLPSALR